ncbi:5-histidylcysteine sulfoxide synthase [Bdellovibrio svalbardensis]|uniref:5-histidylcysteine sulfoxide synthase n=1 Tax=Bdellovibrio svalbardensis TaxID=2972972 RepID=A0ABT6DGM1_9BACT|nr:5-histidylcysteine sulfoxide synthase [Bdellovibrio svalbardensis]MDG0815992.1 5-histidylcysteine sulfoxide synthase [Bdellovibrio svalbardensis]
MSYTVSLQRNPNLSIPQVDRTGANEVQNFFGKNWWTGLPPEECAGYHPEQKFLQALPLVNLQICTRQDVLDYFNNTWTLTEVLFSALKNEATYIRPPYHELRHPLIFYYGHPAVLYYNKLRLAGIVSNPVDLYLEKILETGVDEMSWDDMSKNEMQWPKVQAVHEYRKKIYDIVVNVIKTHPDLEPSAQRNLGPSSPLWSLFMGFEHEKIHFETSSVLIRELPLELVETPKHWAPLHPSALTKTPSKPVAGKDYPVAEWVQVPGGKVEYGKPPSAPSFGWDNEYGSRTKTVKDFQVTNQLISNGEYYEFVAGLGYINDKYWSQEGLLWRKFRNTKRPTFWVAHGPEGLHDYKLRTIFEIVDMPWSWPAEVNYHEAQAYIHWKQEKDHGKLIYRLITEPEHVRLRETDTDPVLQKDSYNNRAESLRSLDYNLNFQFSSANPVNFYSGNKLGVKDLFGNVWQWAEDQFNPLDGFKVHPLYDDFSTPCFDGKHQMILGGSFISCGHEASKWARFHFRPHFFQHAGFRIAATLDGSSDNESTKLKQAGDYVHPRRQNVRDQMQHTDWWKKVNQPLELDETEMKELWNQTQSTILKFELHRAELSPMGTALDPATNDVAKDFRLPYQSVKTFPDRPDDFQKLLKTVLEELVPTGQQPGHPGYMAYVAGSGNAISNMAQALSQTLNQFTGHYSLSPGLVSLEAEALRWVLNMVGYPSQSAGFFTTGGSLATLSAMSLARKAKFKGYDLSRARFYASAHAHHCAGKSLSILGFPKEALTLIAVNDKLQMNVPELEKQIAADLAQGLQPVCVIGTAGSTNTGAIDNLAEISVIAKKNNLWFHVDGAYGGFFLLTEEGQNLLKGIAESDSIILDPHKSLSLPYGTGCLLVRDRALMSYDYTGAPTYMPPSPGLQDEDGRLDFADISPELSRDFRGLRFWLPIKTLGIGPFQVNLEEKMKLAKYLANELRGISDLEVLAEPQLSIVNFKMKESAMTRELLTHINQSQKIFLSGCTVNKEFVIRVCLLGFRSHFAEVNTLLEIIRNSLKEMGV